MVASFGYTRTQFAVSILRLLPSLGGRVLPPHALPRTEPVPRKAVLGKVVSRFVLPGGSTVVISNRRNRRGSSVGRTFGMQDELPASGNNSAVDLGPSIYPPLKWLSGRYCPGRLLDTNSEREPHISGNSILSYGAVAKPKAAYGCIFQLLRANFRVRL